MVSTKSLQTSRRLRLDYLDGLRGLAALYVFLFHSYLNSSKAISLGPLPSWLPHSTNWLGYGHYAVAVFIVLSGYCLSLPLVTSGSMQFQGGLPSFIVRRARRILPPYYACLVISLLGVWLARALHLTAGKSENVTAGAVVSHLAMVHNFSSTWAKAIDPPMWTVATEWDIYFIFALILLPIWRRLGPLACAVCAVGLGLMPHFLLRPNHNLDWACPWYVALFAFGLVSAQMHPRNEAKTLVYIQTEKLPWGTVTAVLIVVFATLTLLLPRDLSIGIISGPPLWATDGIAGLAMAAFLIYAAKASESVSLQQPLVLRIMESRLCMVLGAFSYSLYLIHTPLEEAALRIATRHHTPLVSLVLFCASLPLVVGIAYLFHLAFERPFMSKPGQSAPKTERQAEGAAIVNPAP